MKVETTERRRKRADTSMANVFEQPSIRSSEMPAFTTVNLVPVTYSER